MSATFAIIGFVALLLCVMCKKKKKKTAVVLSSGQTAEKSDLKKTKQTQKKVCTVFPEKYNLKSGEFRLSCSSFFFFFFFVPSTPL